MEVHSHTHSIHKKWYHYFWEFFMLFLAVTLGFLVENRREHYTEHQREKEYARLLYDDLKKDTAWLHRVILVKKWKEGKMDSLLYYISQPDIQKNANQAYYYSSYLVLDVSFEPNDATIQQLRSSGSLRYFTNLKLYNTITQYYNDCAFYLEVERQRKADFPPDIRSALFDANDFYSLSIPTPSILDVVHFPEKKMQLLTADKQVINKFLHYVNNVKLNAEVSVMMLQTFVSDDINALRKALRNEYHLD